MHQTPLKTAIAAALFSFLLSAPAFAQSTSTTPITLGVQTSLHSEIIVEDRPLMIYTPDGYAQSTARLSSDGTLN